MRSMEELVREEVALPSAPGDDEHPALALANSAVALPGGHTADLLGTPAQAEQWLDAARPRLAEGTGLAEVCNDAAALVARTGQVCCWPPVSPGSLPCPPPLRRSTTR